MSSFEKSQTRKKTKRTNRTRAKTITMMTTKTTTATRSERLIYFSGKREHFVKVKVVEEALDSLPQEFRSRIRNVAVLVEDMPPNQPSPQSGQQRRLLRVSSMACPRPRRAYLTYRRGPDYIVLYQKNIEAVGSSEAGVREQIRLTVIHELGHYFGMD